MAVYHRILLKLSGEKISKTPLTKGVHYIEVALNEVPLFLKKGRSISLAKPAMRTSQLDFENLTKIEG